MVEVEAVEDGQAGLGPVDQVALVRSTGNPLSVELRKTFTEVAPPTRLAYRSLIDFVPDHEPYEHLTIIDIEPVGGGHAREADVIVIR